jgi:hypothetical protein
MPARLLVAGTKNFCQGTRMARSYTHAVVNANWLYPY